MHYGVQGEVYRLEIAQVTSQPSPMILHWDFNHFVVYAGRRWGRFVIYDPAQGERLITAGELSQHFTGVGIVFTSQSSLVSPAEPPSHLSLRQLLQGPSVIGQMGLAVVLSVILQGCLLLSPLYIQTVVDDVVLRLDEPLLTSLALGFGLLLFFQSALQYLRDMVVLRFSAALQLQLGERLFRHLLALPLRFFSARHIGDIQSRFNSVDYFRDVFSQQLAVSVVDGVLAVAALLAMLFYSPLLASLVFACSVLYALIVWVCSWWIRRAQQRTIQRKALLDGHFIESVSRIQTIAQMHWRCSRSEQWCDFLRQYTDADVQAKRWRLRLEQALQILQGMEQLVLVYLAAHLVMQQQMTVGMLFAFLAYKGRFSNASQGLVGALMTLRLLPLHRERMEDIAMTKPHSTPSLFGHVQDEVLRLTQPQCAFNVARGECLAIAGRSGGGKSTMLRKLLGLESSDWQIRWGCQLTEIAAVLQGDGLMSGSVQDNVCGFAEQVDVPWLNAVCRIAGVDSFITALPMGLNTHVGDYGHILSAGQSQRVQIARALYKRPKVLVLDEATSHLDVAAEQRLMRALKDPALGMTILMVAHRPDCLAAADRVIELNDSLPSFS
jgi:ATP-binding cassette subfamily B protein RaxB